MLKTFKYRLYPTRSQEQGLSKTLETCRHLYNDLLANRRDSWEWYQESPNKYSQQKQMQKARKYNTFLQAVHSHALQVVIADLDKSFKSFFRRIKSGDTPGYPRFKARDRFDSFGFKEYGNGFRIDGSRLKLSMIGRIRVRWHRPIEDKIKTLRVRKQAGKWFACFSCEVDPMPLLKTGKDVGVDAGLVYLATTSDGKHYDNPKWYRNSQAKLRVIQRTVSRRKKGGSNRRKAVRLLQRQHAKVRNQREDYIKNLVHELITEYDRIAIEKLNIAGMSQNRHLSKSILDAGWGYFASHLAFKAVEAGKLSAQVPAHHTSQTCSVCGCVNSESRASQSVFVCVDCGYTENADINASKNILGRGIVLWGSTQSSSLNVLQEAAGL